MNSEPTNQFFRSSHKRNKIIAVVAALAIVVIGYVLVISRASGFFASISPTTASLSGNATLVVDPQTGKAIQFNAPVAQPPVTPPAGERVCPAFPAFPDASCTGVPAGTKVTELSGDLTTTGDGQVVDSKLIRGSVIVEHNNVTIKNSRITGPILYQTGSAPNVKGLVIKDSDIGPAAEFIGPVVNPLDKLVAQCPKSNNGGTRLIRGSDFTLLRSLVHNNGDDAISVYGTSNGSGTVLMQDNIIDRTCFYPEDHLDAIQLYDPGSIAKVNIVHNKIDAKPVNEVNGQPVKDKGNAAIFWADKPGSGSRLTFYNNLLSGGNYTVYLLDASANSGVIIDGHDNVFTKDSYAYGPCSSDVTVAFSGTSGLKWSNNKFTDGSLVSC